MKGSICSLNCKIVAKHNDMLGKCERRRKKKFNSISITNRKVQCLSSDENKNGFWKNILILGNENNEHVKKLLVLLDHVQLLKRSNFLTKKTIFLRFSKDDSFS